MIYHPAISSRWLGLARILIHMRWFIIINHDGVKVQNQFCWLYKADFQDNLEVMTCEKEYINFLINLISHNQLYKVDTLTNLKLRSEHQTFRGAFDITLLKSIKSFSNNFLKNKSVTQNSRIDNQENFRPTPSLSPNSRNRLLSQNMCMRRWLISTCQSINAKFS